MSNVDNGSSMEPVRTAGEELAKQHALDALEEIRQLSESLEGLLEREGIIEPGEPILLIRGSDPFASVMVEVYASLTNRLLGDPLEEQVGLYMLADQMATWRTDSWPSWITPSLENEAAV